MNTDTFRLKPPGAGRSGQPIVSVFVALLLMASGHAQSGQGDSMSMDMSAMQGGKPPPDARDPHAYAGGQDFGPYRLELGDTHRFGSLLAENLEAAAGDGATAFHYDVRGWYGGLYNRAVVKAEGEAADGQIEDARTELLFSRAFRPYWDAQAGIRRDDGEGPHRTWFGFGVQGLAPYWFELDLTGYVGEGGRTALRLDASYELLFTQRLILEPTIEADAYGQSDRDRGIGQGFADLDLQLRLRYEIRRELAPYIGLSWVRKFGRTRDFARERGGEASTLQFVAGIRFWL